MSELFTSLNFEVETHRDLRMLAIENILQTTSLQNHRQYDAFVCVIMTRGNLGEVFASDGQPMKVLHLMSYFYEKNCPSLQGKPKMFFIEAGQLGKDDDSNIVRPEGMALDGTGESGALQQDGEPVYPVYLNTGGA